VHEGPVKVGDRFHHVRIYFSKETDSDWVPPILEKIEVRPMVLVSIKDESGPYPDYGFLAVRSGGFKNQKLAVIAKGSDIRQRIEIWSSTFDPF
jgi:hypothetical protein